MHIHYSISKSRLAPSHSDYITPEEFELTEIPRSYDESDLRFLRNFILNAGEYVEELESIAGDTSDDFWQAREHAYKIVTAILMDHEDIRPIGATIH
jgi:hypothetical protein